MKSVIYILISLLSVSAVAQQAVLNDGVLRYYVDENSDCPKDQFGFMKQFVQKVNWQTQIDSSGNPIAYKDKDGKKTYDPRGTLSVMGPQIGLTKAQMFKAMTSTGQITCKGTTYGNGGFGTGSLFIDNGQLITNSHMIFDELGRSRGPCEFKNWDPHSQPIALDLNADKVVAASYTPYLKGQGSRDIVVVRLVSKVQYSGKDGKKYDAEAFQPAPDSLPRVSKADRMVVFSAIQLPIQDHDQGTEPITQMCTPGIDPYYTASGSESVLYGDCSATEGSSGSLEVQIVDGVMWARGLVTQTADSKYDSAEYQGPNGKSLTYSIGIPTTIVQGAQALTDANGNTAAAILPK